MIGRALLFLKDHVDGHLVSMQDGQPGQPGADKAVFVDGDKLETLSFTPGAVSLLLVNVEEERTLRAPDPYVRTTADGRMQRVQPEIRLDLHVLFVARFKQYWQAWEQLSQIVQLFQVERAIDRETAPGLPEGIEKLVLELVTLDFSMQNEIWSALRATHHPSLLYRVKMVAFSSVPAPVRIITQVEHEVGVHR